MIHKPERVTQNRVLELFQQQLDYIYLGNWMDRENNSNIEEDLLVDNLTSRGYSREQQNAAIHALRQQADNANRSLYENNHEVYKLLRYGVQVKTDAGAVTETVHLIDWSSPDNNDFAIAEEVTLKGGYERRPDIVLYLNGIAIAVLELKNSRTSLADGIRQNLSNQKPEFNAWFFSTVQFLFAGNDAEGLRYGTTETPEKYYLTWKEDESEDREYKLDKYLKKICNKERLLELIKAFVLFDGGVKKIPRVHQYFGVKAAQEAVGEKRSGIIWHTQGSGKSIVMVLLGRWILENNPNARIAVITDRDELDKQIERVFRDAGEKISRATSSRDLLGKLAKPSPRLFCTLIHKFGQKDVEDFEAFLEEIKSKPSKTVGEVFVFVDECHRTQSGKLHKLMKALLPEAVFIGFTGTPLLKKDKQTSLEIFGNRDTYIHTYKFSEAVDDGVILDLIYEARDIDQKLGSEERIDAWFEAKTRGLNEWQKARLREEWGTMQQVLSSRNKMEKVVSDIIFDFGTKPRISSERGNAILVASSIYEACKYFTLFQKTEFKNRCAVVTSYNPSTQDVTKEETGANTETDRQFLYNTYQELLKDIDPAPGKSKTETYEDRVKKLFVEEPANMKLLIVVDKLLTGFDAPSCTYLYIDKSMQDHGLFQAICRVNRLDGEDKTFGYIVDYKDLFRKVENAIAVYSSELAHNKDESDSEIFLQDRLTKGKERLDSSLETLQLLCEEVKPPGDELQYIHYFCGNTENEEELALNEPKRTMLYKSVASLVRSYSAIADDLLEAGYSKEESAEIKNSVRDYLEIRAVIRRASGEELDLKAYEADMRHLIDTYIEAEEPRKISPFDDIGLLDLIVKTGIADAIAQKMAGISRNEDAVAETIENNIRKKIIKEHLNDPAYFEKMSKLLDEIIATRKAKAIAYEEYLNRIAELVKAVDKGQTDTLPVSLKTGGQRALYNNLDNDEATALKVDLAVKEQRPDGWRGVQTKEQVIKKAIHSVLQDVDKVEFIFTIVKQHQEY